ncbi:troponin C, skeletal muscle-like isoform X1 [Branchiostoma floridae]|uniref:Troponin C, skeletal muscle-like isoform X1 n=1 Tax=Branchiostoma floridae TaxID=7739 RepID=A0A9J7MCQ2_BRAFL|nr:troponin C, skeletal muscle-like isoform X1 [Branchiostoma floridae]
MSDDGARASDSLTKEQVEELQMAFSIFDRDGSGEISTQNLGTILKQCGLNPSRDELDAIMAEADEDGSGTMDFDEFLELMAKQMHQDQYEVDEREVRAAFRIFDKDNDGFISIEELRTMADACGEHLSEDELKDLLVLFIYLFVCLFRPWLMRAERTWVKMNGRTC